MGALFSKPKKPEMPVVPPPPAIPEVGPEVPDYAAKLARKRAGFRSTILTGNLTPMDTGKKQLLGG